MSRYILFVLILQGIYFLATGIWSLVDIEGFMRVTGEKYDIWLVKCVGALIMAISISFFIAIYSKQISLPVMALASLSALALAVIDLYYSSAGVIDKIYFWDGIIQACLCIFWLLVIFRAGK